MATATKKRPATREEMARGDDRQGELPDMPKKQIQEKAGEACAKVLDEIEEMKVKLDGFKIELARIMTEAKVKVVKVRSASGTAYQFRLEDLTKMTIKRFGA